MNTESQSELETTISKSVRCESLSRDEVRGWVLREQLRATRLTRKIVLTTVFTFIALTFGIGLAVNHEVHQIRELVVRRPSPAIISLEEISWELCKAPPADYFVQQLSRRKTSTHSALSSSFKP